MISKFLKISWDKVVLTFLLLVISSISIYAYVARHTLVCTTIGCPTVEKIAMNTTLNSIIPMLIFSYLLSCTFVFLFWKIKKHKKVGKKRKKKK